jgi:hypothetical protein
MWEVLGSVLTMSRAKLVTLSIYASAAAPAAYSARMLLKISQPLASTWA